MVRADYDDIFYMEKALEAIQLWSTDPLYKPFYHESGMIRIGKAGRGKQLIANYETLKTDIHPEILSPEQFKGRYDGFFANADFDGVDEVFVNRKSGWAEASKALEALIDAAVAAGVKYIMGHASALTFDVMGDCTGLRLSDGRILIADKIILSTGAGTAKLLADSAPKRSELHAGNRLVAAAVITGITKVDAQEGKQYTGLPVGVHTMEGTLGGSSFSLTRAQRVRVVNIKAFDRRDNASDRGGRTLRDKVLPR